MATCPARQCCAQACAGGLRGVRITTHAPAPARGPFRPFRTGARGAMCSTRDGHTPPRWYTRGAPRNEHISVQRAFHESRTRLAHWSLSREWTAVHCTYCTKARLAGRAPAQLFQCGHARGATRARARARRARGTARGQIPSRCRPRNRKRPAGAPPNRSPRYWGNRPL